jgi:alpha-tubulin suppressor-like RCC1 family protein
MSGFTAGGEDLERIFFTEQEVLDKFVSNRLWSWGLNGQGQLGDGTAITKSSPVQPLPSGGTNTNWLTIHCGYGSAYGIKNDGTLWSWGDNAFAQLGTGAAASRSSPFTTINGGTNWKSVHGSSRNAAGIKTDGSLWICGYGTLGAIGDGTTSSRSSFVSVTGGLTWKQVSCGRLYISGITTSNTLYSWGSNNFGVLGTGDTPGTSNRSSPHPIAGDGTWKQISARYEHSAGIKSDGTLWTWGSNAQLQLGHNTATTVSASSPTQVFGGGTWKQVATGRYNTLAIKSDGTLWTWGGDNYGIGGTGLSGSRATPGTVTGGGTTWKQVSTYNIHVLAVKTDGTLWGWGFNTSGGLGDFTLVNKSVPTLISNTNIDWKQVSAGASNAWGLGLGGI